MGRRLRADAALVQSSDGAADVPTPLDARPLFSEVHEYLIHFGVDLDGKAALSPPPVAMDHLPPWSLQWAPFQFLVRETDTYRRDDASKSLQKRLDEARAVGHPEYVEGVKVSSIPWRPDIHGAILQKLNIAPSVNSSLSDPVDIISLGSVSDESGDESDESVQS